MDVAVRRIGGRTKQEARVETAESSLPIEFEERTIEYLLKSISQRSRINDLILDPAVKPREDSSIFGKTAVFSGRQQYFRKDNSIFGKTIVFSGRQ